MIGSISSFFGKDIWNNKTVERTTPWLLLAATAGLAAILFRQNAQQRARHNQETAALREEIIQIKTRLTPLETTTDQNSRAIQILSNTQEATNRAIATVTQKQQDSEVKYAEIKGAVNMWKSVFPQHGGWAGGPHASPNTSPKEDVPAVATPVHSPLQNPIGIIGNTQTGLGSAPHTPVSTQQLTHFEPQMTIHTNLPDK